MILLDFGGEQVKIDSRMILVEIESGAEPVLSPTSLEQILWTI